MSLYQDTIRLAYQRPELRSDLLPLVAAERSVVDRFGLKKVRKLMQKYPTAQAFAKAKLSGFGAKSASEIVSQIDAASRTRLNLGQVRKEVFSNGQWYFLHKVPVSRVNPHTHGEVEPSGKEDLSKPIVIGLRGEVLDGRHRVALAKQKSVSELPAYVPAEWFYKDLIG